MPASTPNFGIPYSIPADAADVPLALQRLAERVDTVLTSLELQARPRHMAQFFGNVPNVVPGTATSGVLTWQLTDFNTKRPDGIIPVSETPPAVVEVTDASTTQLTVNVGGFWFVSASVQIGTSASGSGIDLIGLDILRNGAVIQETPATLSHNPIFTADVTHVLTASGGFLLSAGQTVSVRARVDRSSGTASARFLNRSITLLRMDA